MVASARFAPGDPGGQVAPPRGGIASGCGATAVAAVGIAAAFAACAGHAPPRAAAPAEAPVPVVRPGPQRGGDSLLPGRNCLRVSPYRWFVDPRTLTAELPAGDLKVRLPAKWQIRQERPNLVVLLAPPPKHGPRGVFELLVSPRCERYHSTVVHRRVAVRALAHRYAPAAVQRAFDAKHQWKARMGGVGTSVVLVDDLEIGGKRIPLALYYTPVGSSATHEVTFAAACPGGPRGSGCQATFRALFSSAGSLSAAATAHR